MRYQGVVTVILLVAALILLGAGLINLIPSSPVKLVVVRSNSMQPALQAGDIAIVSRHNLHPQPGQIVLYQHQQQLRLHRLIKQLDSGKWLTKGDANPVPDKPPVSTAQIRGVVIGRLPVIGRLVGLRPYLGFITFALAGWLLISTSLIIFHDQSDKKPN